MRRNRSSAATLLPLNGRHTQDDVAEAKGRGRARRQGAVVLLLLGAVAVLLGAAARLPRRRARPRARTAAAARAGAAAPPAPAPAPATRAPAGPRQYAHPDAPVVGLVEEHQGALAYLVRARRDGRLPRPATVVHVDSHADLGAPLAPPGHVLDAVAGGAAAPHALEPYAAPNDHLLLAALAGLVDHVVYVEPPWANQFRCCVYDTNATFDFVVGVDARGRVRVDVAPGATAERWAREHFGHVFWRDGERRTGARAAFARAAPLRVTVVAAEHAALADEVARAVDAPLWAGRKR